MRTGFSLSVVMLLGVMGASQAKAAASYCDGVSGNLVTNCGFETGALSPWTVSGNTTNPPGGFNGGEYGIDAFDAATGNYGLYAGPIANPLMLTQTLSLAMNTRYNISFALEDDAANPDTSVYTQSFSAIFDGSTLVSLLNPSSAGSFDTYSFVFTTGASIASDSISFSFQNDTTFWSFDDVAVTLTTTTSTPEPTSLALLGSGLVALGIIRRRQRQRSAAGGVFSGSRLLENRKKRHLHAA